MKARIVNKNALRMEGTDFVEYGMSDFNPILVGNISFADKTYPLTSGSSSLFFEVYLFYMDLDHAI